MKIAASRTRVAALAAGTALLAAAGCALAAAPATAGSPRQIVTGGPGSPTAYCPDGYHATGGGFVLNTGADHAITRNSRTADGSGWTVQISGANPDYTVYAVCTADS